MKTLSTLLASTTAVVLATTVSAQTATTKPVGYRTETLQPGFNLIGVNLADKIEAAGAFESFDNAAKTLTDNEVNFQNLTLGAAPLILKVLDGAAGAGTVHSVSVTGANTLTAANDFAGLVAAGTKYELRKSHTVASLLGGSNAAGLAADGDGSAADQLWIPTGGGGFKIVYYNDGSGLFPVGWTDSDGAPAGDTPLYYTSGLFVKNSGSASKSLVFVGHVVTSATQLPIASFFNYVSRVLPVGTTLANSGLESQLYSDGDGSTADQLWIPTGPGAYKIVYVNDGSGLFPAGWTDSDGAAAGTTPLTSGMLIRRDPSRAAKALSMTVPQGLDI